MNVYKYLQDNTKQILNEILPRDRRGNSYVCPRCGNGTGADGTGLWDGFYPRYKCYKCGFFGDVIDIVGVVFDLNRLDSVNKACELIGMDYTIEYKKPEKRAYTRDKSHISEQAIKELLDGQREFNRGNYEIIKRASKSKRGLIYASKRGIPFSVSRRFKIGYIEGYGGIDHGVLIPLSKDSFDVRNIDPCEHADRYRKRTGRQKLDIPFNLLNLINGKVEPFFIVEGEFDALSIISAGYPAIALNGNTSEITARLLLESKHNAPVAVIMDNDKAGRDKLESVTKTLQAVNIHGLAVKGAFYKGVKYSDPSEFYQYDSETFKKRLQNIYKKLN